MSIKENSADIIQHEKLARENELSKKSRVCDIVITVLFCLFIGSFTIYHIINTDRDFSEKENRVLKSLPEFSYNSLFSGEYTSEMTTYLSDQFPLRDLFVSIKSGTEYLSFRMENSGIIFGDDCLTAKLDSPNYENLQTNIEAADVFSEFLINKGIPCIFSPAPRRVDVCIDDLPTVYGDDSQNELWNVIDSYADSFHGTFVSGLRERLLSHDSMGEEVFYRTDHHWTSLGAYYAYDLLYSTLPDNITSQINKRDISYFTPETVTENFYGTSYSSSGASWISPDKIDLYRFDGDDNIPVKIVDTDISYEGLYRREYLDKKDKYSIFLGENAGRVDIGVGDKPKIVIIKDSFAQSIIPFFAADFDVVMIDPRYFSGSIFREIEDISPDAVIILLNADTLTSDDVLLPLKRGIK